MYCIFYKRRIFGRYFLAFHAFFYRKYCRFQKKPYLCTAFEKTKCPDGGIGRRAGLKHQWIHFHPGSTPGLGTGKTAKYLKINT